MVVLARLLGLGELGRWIVLGLLTAVAVWAAWRAAKSSGGDAEKARTVQRSAEAVARAIELQRDLDVLPVDERIERLRRHWSRP